jgi:hypothetical protein
MRPDPAPWPVLARKYAELDRLIERAIAACQRQDGAEACLVAHAITAKLFVLDGHLGVVDLRDAGDQTPPARVDGVAHRRPRPAPPATPNPSPRTPRPTKTGYRQWVD